MIPKYSEFKALVLYALVTVADGTAYVNISETNMLTVGGLVAAYIGGRSFAKSSEAKTGMSSLKKALAN